MNKINILFVIFLVLQVSLARRIPREAATVNDLKRSTFFGDQCYHAASEGLRMLGRSCPVIAPQFNYTELVNLVVISQEANNFIAEWNAKMQVPDSNKKELLTEICAFLSNNDRVKKASPSEIVSYDIFCEMTVLTEKAKNESLSEIEQYGVAKKICGVLNSADRIATVPHESNAEVTTEQLAAFKSQLARGNCSYLLDCSDAKSIANVCTFFNETVTPEDQAKELGISIPQYNNIVEARKLYTDKTDAGRLAVAKRSCEAAYEVSGNGINLADDKNALTLTFPTNKLEQFTDLWIKYYEAANSEKYSTLRNLCGNFMGEFF